MNDEEKCGEYAAPLVPRLHWNYSCSLPKDHEGEHRAGGTCLKHGPYVMEHFNEIPQCPQWPDCIKPKEGPHV